MANDITAPISIKELEKVGAKGYLTSRAVAAAPAVRGRLARPEEVVEA